MMCPKVHIRVLMILAPICNKAYHVILEDMKIKILQKKLEITMIPNQENYRTFLRYVAL